MASIVQLMHMAPWNDRGGAAPVRCIMVSLWLVESVDFSIRGLAEIPLLCMTPWEERQRTL
jgi:hypothetical protein